MFRGARRSILGLAVAASLALGVTSAQAANVVPNPGFETGCNPGPVPCQWFAFSGASILHYPVTPHSGSWDMRMISAGTSAINTADSDCVAVTGGATYNLSIWYRVAAGQLVTFVGFGPVFYSDANCTTFLASPAGAQTNSASADGLWHRLTGQVAAPITAQSARLQINITCNQTCPQGAAADFDDAFMDTGPLAATVTSLSASRSSKGIVVRWRTGTEADVIGFHLYRGHAGKQVRADRRLIPARGSVSGARYSFRDRLAPHGKVLYRLQAVSRDGTRTWYGPARVSR
jgi:hypothetical protein